MPFTPLHMGQGIFIKALLQGSFSLMVFGWAQIVMDLQPLYVMLNHNTKLELHGFSHTYLGATLLALIAAVSGKFLSEFALSVLKMPEKISWLCAVCSAFIGTYSHVLLDSIMHDDIQPFFPLSPDNPFVELMTIEQLHGFCLVSGLIGGLLYYVIQMIKNVKE